MGLDVSHIKLTTKPNDKGDYFYIDDWELDCNVSLKHYSKFITTIDDFDFNKTIAIVKNEEQFEKLKNKEWFGFGDYLKIFIGELNNQMQKNIRNFINLQKMDSLETIQLSNEHNQIEYYTISFGEPIKIKGIYYIDDIGYQRKGMNNQFYDVFKKYMLWGNKQDFDLAYSCVSNEWHLEHWGLEAVNGMKKNFKDNFIGKYEFGKSLLSVSF